MIHSDELAGMFWNKAKQLLKDKDAGLVFNWRNSYPLKYPLLGFLFLSLVAHFFFLQLFQFPEHQELHGPRQTATVYLLSETDSPITQRVLSKVSRMSIAAPRGSADIDPLARGIDDQLYQPLTAGVFGWNPRPKEYPDNFFEETGTSDFRWDRELPPVDLAFQKKPSANETREKIRVQPRFNTISDELKKNLGQTRPEWNDDPALAGKTAHFIVAIGRDGKVIMTAPFNKNGTENYVYQKAERWLRSLPWMPSPDGARGIVNLEWEEAKNVRN